jgi:hypothetical protein
MLCGSQQSVKNLPALMKGSRFLSSKKTIKVSFVSTGSIPIGMDKYNKKIMIVTIRDPDLSRVEN